MADMYKDFFADDNVLLASVLEDNLRYNNEQMMTKSIGINTRICIPGDSSNVNKLGSTIVDLCESPKKNPTVQSRLSHFFKKPISDVINDKQENQTDELFLEIDSLSTVHNNDDKISSSSAIFYKGPDAEGFHLSSGSNFVYPSNFPVREYQMNIIKTALFNNTLVSLPTGMGKTFIAAVVMYNFYRWYPMGKIVFMAPTRPLVTQQIEACHSIMGFSRDVTFEMTGNIPPEQRYLAWKKYRVFFLTPQVMANDLNLNKCPSDMIKCVIVDEAHRATKDYAYVQVLKYLHRQNQMFRIVGLSATPGTTIDTVIQVIQNLNISKLEFRTDESPDVMKYVNKKDVQCIPVKLTNAILHIRTQFLAIYDNYSRRLKQYHVLPGNITNLSKFQILTAKQKFFTSNLFREMPKSLAGCLINDFTVCISLAYTLELLLIYGIKVFYLQSLELSENNKCLSNDNTFQSILHDINRELNLQDLTWSHPKLSELKRIVQNYFSSADVQSNSKIIIFCQYRLVVVEVFELLKTFGSSVKPVMFVGQSLKEKGGLPQKKQLEVMNRFKCGDFNVLIATSVAEEGLDIGEVDLIICLEANRSPIKFIQRLGRTGRKRSGKCITLLTEGKEQMKYNSSVTSSKTLVLKMLKNKTVLSNLAPEGPRLIPKHIEPKRLMIHVKPPENHLSKNKKEKCKRENNNILRCVAPNEKNEEDSEEERLDIFLNVKDKSKRRSKKRKNDETEPNDNGIEVKSPTGRDFGNNDFNAPASVMAPLDLSDSNSNGEQGRSFIAEANAFNEWVESCERSDSVALNNKFFELLNLFTDSPTAAVNVYDGEPLKYSTDLVRDIVFAAKPEIDDLKCKNQRVFDENSEVKNSNNENGQSQRNMGGNYVSDDHGEDWTGAIIITDEDSTGAIADGDAMGDTDFEEFIRSQRAEIGGHDAITNRSIRVCECRGQMSKTTDCKCYDNEQRRAEQTDFKNDVVDLVDDDSSDDEERAKNADFLDMFKSQKADCYIEDYYMNKIDELSETVAAVDDDDDVVSVCYSPEFFSGMLPKKMTQTKLKDCLDTAVVCKTPEIEFTDLCSPSPPRFAEDKSVTTDRIATGAVTAAHENNYLGTRSGKNAVPSPRTGYEKDDDMDFMFADCFGDSTDVFTQRAMTNGGGSAVAEVSAGLQTSAAEDREQQSPCRRPDSKRKFSPEAAEPCGDALKTTVQPVTASVSHPYGSGLVPFNIMKACNLLKPGFSLKRSTAAATMSKAPLPVTKTAVHDDVSPIRVPGRRQLPAVFSQSTPKVPADASQAVKRPQEPCATEKILNFLTSSSDDDDAEVFVNGNMATGDGRRPVPKKRRPKRKKKLVFIDDEADVSNCGDPAAAAAVVDSSGGTSSSHDDDEFDSSFIDDDQDKSGPSTSMTKQYLQSVRSPANAHGVFKIPMLSKRHYNIDVYSQMVDDKIDSSYEEDSFCVGDESVLSEKLPPKRKRILTSWSSDSDSPGEQNDNAMRKRRKF